jgi:aminotransferase
MITLDGMRVRTIVVNGMSKPYSVTGWRVGDVLANPPLTGAIRKMLDFLTVGAPAPLQDAGAVAMRLPDAYYADLAAHYQARRDRLLAMLRAAGLQALTPRGAYYAICDIADWGFPNDVEFARHLVREVGVAAVPGSSFFRDPVAGKDLIRFTFCKKKETFDAAEARLAGLARSRDGASGSMRVTEKA